MTAVPAPPPSVTIDRSGAGEGLSASTAVALPLHASTACWQLRLVLLQHLGVLYAGSGVMQGRLLNRISWASHCLAHRSLAAHSQPIYTMVELRRLEACQSSTQSVEMLDLSMESCISCRPQAAGRLGR